ncbi:hypothetical protein BP5796_01155 [Coleophoma crateriformis]|uniref:Cytochrome P450 n=1 Tax=Coleophoma crateriformis TaxID=565419 RepID=A0A3D8T006_9HELO|nr:hypothetical protein BP5796_01155 [Coleophoma crateriformis]
MGYLPAQLSLGRVGLVAIVLTLSYALLKCIYNLYFHPLARYPGPRLAAVSNAWYGIHWLGGKYPQDVAALHQKYGDVVRVAPNELSFNRFETYKEIYGHPGRDRAPFLKAGGPDKPNETVGIATTRNPQVHAQIRKNLSPAFSTKALRLQTDVVLKYVHLFVEQLSRHGTKPEGVPMQQWYVWLTFDIIGDLAFGESFGAVAGAKTSPWVETIYSGTEATTYADVIRRIPLLMIFTPYILYMNRQLLKDSKQFFALSRQKLKTRLGQDNSRDDFFSHILSQKTQHISEDYLVAEAQTLIVAGSETTSTFLSSVTYFLSTTPLALSRLQSEIRAQFTCADEINADSTAKLPYLSGVIEEGLRIFSPASFGLPRVCPGAIVNGQYIPAGVTVHTLPWSTQHDPKYWHEPSQFCPERWLPADHEFYDPVFEKDEKGASKPFSVGPRSCVGINLAYMEMRIILATLVWHFDWEMLRQDLDWIGEAKLKLLWRTPELRMRYSLVDRSNREKI